MVKPAVVEFLRDEFSSLGLIVEEATNSNRFTVCDSNFVPLKEYYFKMRNSDSDRGFWGPMKSIIDALLAKPSSEDCTLVLVTDTKIYSLNRADISLIPSNFKLNGNKQYLIFEEDLVEIINPYSYNL
ncbi:hypothetical protein N4T77_15720 [Clostridium sp. CX1]|uniref:hypothetical protein n=1 Tax=Clostridium sp. CX1 TaxID=2978346 RepID=UPI0021C19153|nr:hypothetical protein [Clostridium sp. CX1]MCT8978041.1 hypothetical protein [Clostridium sp. CX1]